MEKLKRRIFFWILAVLFILTTTYVIFYARGYRFDFSKGIFVHSGTITIKSNPISPGIEDYIGGCQNEQNRQDPKKYSSL
jgi:hypothetical protein